MDFLSLLGFVFLTVFLVLALLLIMALRAPKEEHYRDHHTLLPQSKQAHSHWRNVVFQMLVMRPWPYKDLYNPLNRLYWPEEQANNRVQRRQRRRRRNR